jgi:hypothetical protein
MIDTSNPIPSLMGNINLSRTFQGRKQKVLSSVNTRSSLTLYFD